MKVCERFVLHVLTVCINKVIGLEPSVCNRVTFVLHESEKHT
jgi:hypothetical protein